VLLLPSVLGNMNPSEKMRLLEEIAAIPAMERGKLSAHSAGPYHKLQRWQDGKNHTRHVAADELPAVQSALEGYAQYQRLTEQYANLVIEETRQTIAGAKKKKPSRLKSSSPRRKKSSN
jgi:hypothetical protein